MTSDPHTSGAAHGHRTVTSEAIQTFGCLTGDYAQMHFDQDYGPRAGMGGTIAHGLLSAAWSLGALAQHAPERLAQGDPGAWLAGLRVRFERMVYVGDLFSLRCRDGDGPCVEGLTGGGRIDTAFEVVNQHGEITTVGGVSVASGDPRGIGASLPDAPALLDLDGDTEGEAARPSSAEELLVCGPRGESPGRTVTEADLVNYANFTGERNPLYLDQEFARSARFGARIAPPMWTFCIAFGEYLRELLRVPMPSSGFAGHLGDSWRLLAPIYVGDTLRTRHKPVAVTPSRSRPDKAIVEFALQVVNQRREVVQDGTVAMMLPARFD